jgi:transposase
MPAPRRHSDRALAPTMPAAARVVRAVRTQREWVERDLDSTLPDDHVARTIWAMLERMDLSALYASVQSVVGEAGRPASDPRVLLGLWLLATVEGVGSARQLACLSEQHDAYRWMRGGVPVNYHQLADFRVGRQAALDALLTQVVGSLLAAGAVTLTRVAQDGTRVRASAGAASYRGRDALARALADARAQVERLAREREHPDPTTSKRAAAAQQRAARERTERVEQALAYLPQAEHVKAVQRRRAGLAERRRVTEPRLSTTDPQARVMKMSDAGYRPAYNVQLATDADSGVVVGVAVSASGSDAHQAPPMLAQVRERTGRLPGAYLMDGGFAAREAVTAVERQGVEVYAPVRLPRRRPATQRFEPRYGDTAEVERWRARMAQPAAQATYRKRAASAEWVNAQVRGRFGLDRFTVRGADKALSVVLLVVLTHNLLRAVSLLA